MKSQRRITPYLFTIFFFCLFLFLGAFTIGVSKGNAAKHQINFPVQSQVPIISVVDSAVKDGLVYITFRNESKKVITAITIGNNSAAIRTEYLNTPEAISAEGTFATQFDLPDKTTKVIYLLAAAFDDGTAEGVPQFVKQIQDTRAGNQTQLERILPIFQDCVAEQCWTSEENLQKILLKLQNLPESEEGKSQDYNAALINAKNCALMKAEDSVQAIKTYGINDAHVGLTYLKKTYEEKLKAWSSAVVKQR